MTRLRTIALSAMLILICYSSAVAYHAPLSFATSVKEVLIPPENYPGLRFQVNYGPFQYRKCDYPADCPPPPPGFGILVEWQSPNATHPDPNCWVPVFAAMTGLADGSSWCRIFFGEGDIVSLDHTMFSCCWIPLSCGVNRFIITVGPIVSGNYRVRLLSYDWYEWHEWMGCDPQASFGGWGRGRWIETKRATGVVRNTIIDYISFMQLFYMDTDPVEPDTVFNGGAVQVLTYYRIYCKIISTKPPGSIPQQLTGYLYPEGVMDPTQVNFVRWPEGDPMEPCDPDYPLRIYTYQSTQAYRPLDLFPYIPPEDWHSLTRLLTCRLFGEENQVRNDIENTVTVMLMMLLDRENDSTMCFIPAATDTMHFAFLFHRGSLGLDEDSDVRFRVEDKDNTLVYEDPVRISYIDSDPNDFGFPDFPQIDSMRISWDGRMNSGPGADHLANPHNDPYTAQVHLMENNQPVISSNSEGFDAVPWIDSVLVTHMPWSPPVERGGDIDIYSIFRAKLDDSDIPGTDFEYYIPSDGVLPSNIRFWDAESYLFHDLLPNTAPKQYYEDLNTALSVNPWQEELWGSLHYKWFHVRGYGYRTPDGESHVGYLETDTTEWWGPTWKAQISNNVQYRSYYGHPYMCLMVKNLVRNEINGYTVNTDSSDVNSFAHKIMMSYHPERFPQNDIVFWSLSQIGVPYFYGGKEPYTKVDCSGFVTSARIQEIGNDNNDNLRIAWINVTAYVNGFYYYGGDSIDLHTEHIGAGEAVRGDLVAIRSNNSPNDWSKAHIGIIDWIIADRETNYIYHSYMVHACGKAPPFLRRVRYDNLLFAYRPVFNGTIPWGGTFIYQFLQFIPDN
jgi:hypothetical protein